MKEKSKFLNQKPPLYSTRNNPNVVVFRIQSKDRQQQAEKNLEDTKRLGKTASWRINAIKDAYCILREKAFLSLFTKEELCY